MRKMAGGFVAKLLMGFLVITFAVWGIGDVFTGGNVNYAAKVGSDTISVGEFQRQKDTVARRAEAAGFKDLDPKVMEVGILRQMVQQRLIGLALNDLGLFVNEKLLARTLTSEPAFKGKDGKFSKAAFLTALEMNRTTEAAVLADIKNEITAKFLLDSLNVEDITPPDAVRKLSITTAMETRDAWIVTIAPVNAPTLISKEALQEFYEQNKNVLYVKPESRTLEYVTLKPSQIESAIDKSITDDMLKEAAKRQPEASPADIKNRLRAEQRERVMHDLEAALDDALAGGATLGDALSKANLTAPIKTLADVREDSLKPDADEVTKTVIQQGFQMGDGETSGLIATPGGTPLIVHVKSLTASGAQPYETVAADVHDKVAEQQRGEAARKRVLEVKQALSDAVENKQDITDADVQAVLAKFNLNARKVNDLRRPEGKAAMVNGVPASLQQAIFERQVGAVAGPLALGSGSQMLAVVSAAHHPEASVVDAKVKLATDKQSQELSELLTQSVQARGFGTFAEKHKVKLNPALLNKGPQGAEAE